MDGCEVRMGMLKHLFEHINLLVPPDVTPVGSVRDDPCVIKEAVWAENGAVLTFLDQSVRQDTYGHLHYHRRVFHGR